MVDLTQEQSEPIVFDVWDLKQYIYCQKKFYFYKVLGLQIMERPKMIEGQKEHEAEKKRSAERNTCFGIEPVLVSEVKYNFYVEDESMGIKGIVDAIILLKSGEIIPVEIKYGTRSDRIYPDWKKQLTAYALLLEALLGKTIKEGIIYVMKTAHRIKIDPTMKNDVKNDLKKMKELFLSEKEPKTRFGRQCNYCELRKFCLET